MGRSNIGPVGPPTHPGALAPANRCSGSAPSARTAQYARQQVLSTHGTAQSRPALGAGAAPASSRAPSPGSGRRTDRGRFRRERGTTIIAHETGARLSPPRQVETGLNYGVPCPRRPPDPGREADLMHLWPRVRSRLLLAGRPPSPQPSSVMLGPLPERPGARPSTMAPSSPASIAFFCDTHAPWQKGGVAIGRLRRGLPRKTDSFGGTVYPLPGGRKSALQGSVGIHLLACAGMTGENDGRRCILSARQ